MNYNHQHMYDLCKKHMHSYCLAEMSDGNQIDGIITGVDDEYLYMAVPIEPEHQMAAPDAYHNWNHRQGGFGYGYPGYGGYGGYSGYGRPRRRRFNRLVLPLAALTALSVLPWY
ncbi:hypothetical protein [Lentibacillus amyloliquefaciens]|uniref:Phosphatidylinositol kinase n=1 Tax=Lentibacillus amyloliquefaciens TaxID=1472767 RepID=A0A0U4EDJ5_9BACI|nr:hypothetical protein [Lentibacillus amyloliquefaciens]ALX48649.1 hypothetical protein AOX59_08520 [Lentibacillus amyloliquefaciens]